MDGVVFIKFIEWFVEVISVEEWMKFVNIYDIIESNICKRSEVKFFKLFFKLGLGWIEFEEKNFLDVFKKDCWLESGIKFVKEKL